MLKIVTALAVLALALPGLAWAPPIEDGGSTYCSAPLNGYTGYIGGWPVRCQYSAAYGGYWSSYDGWVFGCGQYGGYCWHWARY